MTDDGVDWRPMFGLRWTRTAEPTPGSLVLLDEDDDDSFELTAEEASHPESAAKLAVWESVLAWMKGEGPVPSQKKKTLSVAEVSELAALVGSPLGDGVGWSRGSYLETGSESETQRVGASYSLGAAIRQDGDAGEVSNHFILTY